VLRSAQVLQHDVSSSNKNVNTLSIIDLGFGCGETNVYISKITWTFKDREKERISGGSRSLCWHHTGSSHFRIAQERLGLSHQIFNTVFEIHCADAGRPASWALEIRNAVSQACTASDENGRHENWLLGLDSLIHFQPSRWPLSSTANRKLDASLMAYDLCIAENLSARQRIILRLMAYFGQSPVANWVYNPRISGTTCHGRLRARKDRDPYISENVFAH